MKALMVMMAGSFATAGLPAPLVWTTVLVWMAVAFLLATVVTVVADRARAQARARRARLSWSCRVPLQACAPCAR